MLMKSRCALLVRTEYRACLEFA
uniref:Uncharacterized protein n=1 Tax=Anguilla anguilla TaxID=7936 RepID=A0A0E9Q1G6_ANGAN